VVAANQIPTWAGRCQGRCLVQTRLRDVRILLHLVLSQILALSVRCRLGWVRHPENRLPVLRLDASKKAAANRHLLFLLVITSSTSPTQADLMPLLLTLLSAYKSILPLSNAVFVRSDLPEHTIYDHTFALIPMKDRSYVLYAAKLSLDNMTESDMRACTPARRSLCVKASLGREVIGAAAANSHEQMLLDVISDPRLEEYASSLSLMRKLPKELEWRCWHISSRHSMCRTRCNLYSSR
jgi:hypothetical protein